MSEQVHIFSAEHGAYWRPGACGYTNDVTEAGLWLREEAESRIKGSGTEKKLRLVPTGIPVGFKRVDAYESDTQIIVCGEPEEEPEGLTEQEYSRWYETAHNCDAMGCGLSHVLYRFSKPSD
jgi:hypothetical protein